MRHVLGLLLCLACLTAGENWSPRPGFTVLPDGRVQVGGLSLELTHWNDGWARSGPPKAVQATGRQRDGVWQLDSPWTLAEGTAALRQTVRSEGADAVRLEAQLDKAGATRSFALAITLDNSYRGGELRIDGTADELCFHSRIRNLRVEHGSPGELRGTFLPDDATSIHGGAWTF